MYLEDKMLRFSVKNQIITRTNEFRVVARSRNYLYAQFDFATNEWQGVKTALFYHAKLDKPKPAILDDNNVCQVPWEWLDLDETTFGTVSIFCGDLVTANVALVEILKSGYAEGGEIKPPTPDVYAQLTALIQQQIDSLNSAELDYVEQELALLLNGEVKTSVKLKEVELRNDGVAIQWKYKSDAEWQNLVLLSDLKGAKGDSGATFTPSVNDGVLTWTNDKELPNPEPLDIKTLQEDTGWIDILGTSLAADKMAPPGWGTPVQYRKVGNEVTVQGTVGFTGGGAGLIFTMPEGYRPSKDITFLTDAGYTSVTMYYIEQNGEVVVYYTRDFSNPTLNITSPIDYMTINMKYFVD